MTLYDVTCALPELEFTDVQVVSTHSPLHLIDGATNIVITSDTMCIFTKKEQPNAE